MSKLFLENFLPRLKIFWEPSSQVPILFAALLSYHESQFEAINIIRFSAKNRDSCSQSKPREVLFLYENFIVAKFLKRLETLDLIIKNLLEKKILKKLAIKKFI